MTTAVCVCCGATKLGEFTPRLECKFDPRENEDKAPAMVFADHFFLSLEDMSQVSECIKSPLPSPIQMS